MFYRIVILASASIFLFNNNMTGNVIKVTSEKPKSIEAAIKSAAPGDTLLLTKGVYRQHDIHIYKRLTIIGEQYPVIDAEKKSEVFVISADSTTIQGLQIQNTGVSSLNDMAAIRVQEKGYANISGNKLINCTYGVYIQKGHHCEVKNNQIHAKSVDEQNSGNGIHAWKSSNLLINYNQISGHRDGIYFEFVTQSKISNNISKGNIRYGLHFMFSNHDSYINNTFSDNGAGVAVMFSNHVTML